MDRRLAPLALVALLLAATSSTLGAPPGPAQERVVSLDVTAVQCPHGDGVCLAYGGTVPGPMLDVNLGDRVVLTLVNRIPETVWALDAPAALKARLANASVSFHVHGTALPASSDGIAPHEGTQLVASFAPPGGSHTYRFRAAFVGTWHYHDHVLGLDGSEGAARGLYGGLVVRSGAEPRADHVLDLHLLDEGPNGGRGLDATVAANESFELVVVGLQNLFWKAELRDPSGALVGKRDLGPGMSERIRVDAAQPGTYTWSATWGFEPYSGTVVVS